MRILCRADASLAIGSGHIVRCATLAQALAEEGHEVEFICRRLPGDLHEWLAEQGFPVRRIDASSDMHSDARLCRAAIAERRFDWLVVDHYELGAEWENAMAGIADGIAAIDDLGRKHECDLLLDQNYPKSIEGGYEGRTPIWCERLLGPAFALVRPEFAKLRSASLCRPRTSVSRLLVFMSGSDPGDETSKALSGIAGLDRPHLAVDVVIGANNPHRAAVERACRAIAEVRLHVQTARMAELMAAADCMIGAGGNATWERCTLGLPALVAVLAENQAPATEALDAAGAHRLLGWHSALAPRDYARAVLALDSLDLGAMSAAAANICDGEGVKRVVACLTVRRCGGGRRSVAFHA